MGRLEQRLERLEGHPASGLGEYEDSVSREVLRRMTDTELDNYVVALQRRKSGEEATAEDVAIVVRAGELREEVEHGRLGA